MILILVIAAASVLLVAIFALLPAWTPVDLAGAAADLADGAALGLFDVLAWLNYYVPVSEMLAVLTLQCTIWAAVRGVQLAIWLGQLFHVVGGGD